MTPSIRVVKGSAGHILAEAFLFGGPRTWGEARAERQLRTKIRRRRANGIFRQPRRPKRKLRLTFLRLLSHHPMTTKPAHPGQRKAKQARRLDTLQATWQPPVSP